MSDSPNPAPPSNTPNRPSGDANGFNWRVAGLMGVAAVILGAAYFTNPLASRSAKAMTYSEFQAAWDQQRIVVDTPKQPLKVITTDTSADATISGWFVEPQAAPKAEDPKKISACSSISPSSARKLTDC
ncbi:MAG: hypothetical protein HC845_14495 [Akkermansiaceae bacterium]|nr:hypothetical protein [Akkermansiaceae bacterium]